MYTAQFKMGVLLEVTDNIQGVDFYVIMCSEATDVKNISEFVMCLRWVDNELEAYDDFIGLKNMPNTDADSVVQLLRKSPKRDAKLHSIQAENNPRGSNEDDEFVDGIENFTIKLFCQT